MMRRNFLVGKYLKPLIMEPWGDERVIVHYKSPLWKSRKGTSTLLLRDEISDPQGHWCVAWSAPNTIQPRATIREARHHRKSIEKLLLELWSAIKSFSQPPSSQPNSSLTTLSPPRKLSTNYLPEKKGLKTRNKPSIWKPLFCQPRLPLDTSPLPNGSPQHCQQT